MKVLLIHEHGRSFGSGGQVAMYRLHEGLRRAGVDSLIACRRRGSDSPEFVELPRSDFLENWLGKVTWRVGLNDVHCVSSFKIKNFKPFEQADVINIHGAHSNFFSYMALPGMAARKPVICTMHDMWHITGHCATSLDCQRWKTGCGRCPYLDVYPPVRRDATAIEWKLKDHSYRRSRDITFVAPSQWLLNMCRQSMVANCDLRQIPNPVDHEIYKPMDQRAARAQLGLPQDKHIILFVSVAIKSWGKGGDLLVQALESLPQRIKDNSILLALGERSDEFAQACGIQAHALGYVSEDDKKAVVYSAADALVQPSRAENQSLVALEAMSCGTPVVAFDVGGMAEIVLAGPGGIIAPAEDVEEFGRAIANILVTDELCRALAEGARRSIVENYTLDLHAQRYIALYREKLVQRQPQSLRVVPA
ncbi:MAG: glycosyltransferase [Phycisphaerales bacterium]|nr:glycosyltransferase [Phycisphaerales bacterium]MCI0675761.1 glycosyltransferase [Phycisphaerales bacterium]